MNYDELILTSVAWKDGMLLRAAHLEYLERYADSGLLWVVRHCFGGEGLVGSGPRLPRAERTAAASDPFVDFKESDAGLEVQVHSCRGLTAGGYIIDIPKSRLLKDMIEAEDVPTSDSVVVYIVLDPFEKRPHKDTDRESSDAGAKSVELRIPKYTIRLNLSEDDQDRALAVARLIRSDGDLHRDPEYIPPCVFMSSHSLLAKKHLDFAGELQLLLSRFLRLHRAMRSALRVLKRYGEELLLGVDDITFAGRMIVTLETCLHEIADPIVSPGKFVFALRRLLRSAGLYVSVSTDLRTYLDQVEEHLGIDYEEPILAVGRRRVEYIWTAENDLSDELAKLGSMLEHLKRLELSIEAKYIDYRVNLRLAEVPFLIDDEAFYRRVKGASVYQGTESNSQIDFEFDNDDQVLKGGSDQYRLVLVVGHDTAPEPTGQLKASFYFNGSARAEERLSTKPRKGQRNYDFAIRIASGLSASRLTVSFPSGLGVHEGLIYQRRYLERERTPEGFEPLNYLGQPAEDAGPGERRKPSSNVSRMPSWEAAERKRRSEGEVQDDYRSKYAQPNESVDEGASEHAERGGGGSQNSGRRGDPTGRRGSPKSSERNFLSDD